ncbi:MAG: cysteine hydrolase [Lachnospiraceae bacterium]|nr:cysteine hydrolase [Lachnospiraceae bacterium]
MNILIVVDMQKDFVDGVLGTPEAVKIVPNVVEKVKNFKGKILFTRDTHGEDYMSTQEGRNLPVPHCIKGSEGWEICQELKGFCKEDPIDKPTFGSAELGQLLKDMDQTEKISCITLVGLCTDICVISNAMLIKAFLPETEIIVDASCCAGVTPGSHQTALDAMKTCQIKVIGE